MNRIYPRDVMDLAYATHGSQRPGMGVTPADIAEAIMKDRTARLMRHKSVFDGVDHAKPGSDQTVLAVHDGATGEQTWFVTMAQHETVKTELARVKAELGDTQRTVDALRNNMRHWHDKFCQEKDRADETERKHKAVKAEYAEFVKQHEKGAKAEPAVVGENRTPSLKPGTKDVCLIVANHAADPAEVTIRLYPRDACLRLRLDRGGTVYGYWDGNVRSGVYGALVDTEEGNGNG